MSLRSRLTRLEREVSSTPPVYREPIWLPSNGRDPHLMPPHVMVDVVNHETVSLEEFERRYPDHMAETRRKR